MIALAKIVLAIAIAAAIAPVALGPVPVLFNSIILAPGSSAGLVRAGRATERARSRVVEGFVHEKSSNLVDADAKRPSQASLRGLRGGIGHTHAARQGGVYHN
jgi:hypothetical protein